MLVVSRVYLVVTERFVENYQLICLEVYKNGGPAFWRRFLEGGLGQGVEAMLAGLVEHCAVLDLQQVEVYVLLVYG